ncbi:acyl-CoA dehydrogenase family protein [Sandaracinobacter sp. RS1-74]|uniref:acyl-CoA dehydrogenase family protein n=1 Tax=Sandaracinobacteroides sayramensis TaxID=2913411 RepID=UPI001EDBA27C|nr:acyl-CoA dehydrogenase family protein [Sandaracinobacteroides sayramensis]MCG2842023.1 acyl-CoA dehydrogenase family protein [Sandaracinobacteroides sayramensis]
MRYQPSRSQRALIAELDDALVSILPLARLHDSPLESPSAWEALDALGLFGLAAPESAGGSGLGALEEALLANALGRRLAGADVFATLAAVHAENAGRHKPGERTTPAFHGSAGVLAVGSGAIGPLLLRQREGGAALHSGPFQFRPVDGNPWLDPLLHLGDLGATSGQFDGYGLLRLRLIDAAALAGIAEATLGAATDYAGLREQFGRPIGSFQAVKHHCANMAVAAREAGDLVTFAALAIDQGRADAAFLAESAFAVAARAAIGNAGASIQIHGAIGFSDEADPHLFLKRARLLVAIGGGVETALERIAAMPVAQAA